MTKKYEKFEEWMLDAPVVTSNGDSGKIVQSVGEGRVAVLLDRGVEILSSVWNLEFIEVGSTRRSPIPWEVGHPSFEVGDRVKFKKASIDNGMIDATEKDSFNVIAVSEEHWGVVVKLEGCAGYVSTSYLEHIKEDEMENTEKSTTEKGSQINWEEGQIVYCLIRGKGQVNDVGRDSVVVWFDKVGAWKYTDKGELLGYEGVRTLFFSEPTIIADTMPPKKPFVPKLKEGDEVLIKDKQGFFGEGTVRVVHKECDDRIYVSKDGDYFMKYDIASLRVIGEEIKFQ